MSVSRRNFLKTAGIVAGGALVGSAITNVSSVTDQRQADGQNEGAADYTIRIAASPVEIAPKKIISVTILPSSEAESSRTIQESS